MNCDPKSLKQIKMVNVGLIGAGKMGISHLSILGAHPNVMIKGVCDTSKIISAFLDKYTNFRCYSSYKEMFKAEILDAVIISVPTRYHYPIIKDAISAGLNIFSEKPFCLNTEEGMELVELSKRKNIITQIGYHNRFNRTFMEVKSILQSHLIGEVYHFNAEAYGPVVTKNAKSTWRSNPSEGGGCLLDYASHVLDLVHYLLSPVKTIKGSLVKSVFSEDVEDCVYSLLELANGVSGVLSVNWSDDTFRKMSTSITVIGTKGKIVSDANELKVHFKDNPDHKSFTKGWNIRHITDFTSDVEFYLRGEEYSEQLDYFIRLVDAEPLKPINNFETAFETDRAVEMIKDSISK